MEKNDTFRLLTEEQAGFLLGLIAGGLFVYDVTCRALERFAG
jgi:hypothetical protein